LTTYAANGNRAVFSLGQSVVDIAKPRQFVPSDEFYLDYSGDVGLMELLRAAHR
jgi:hypothetical protein